MLNKWIIIGILAVAVVFIGITNSDIDADIIVYFPNDKDFVNPDEGRATFNFRFPAKEFKVGGELADSLMFLDSQTIPELRIPYNQIEKRIYAGIPLLATEEVTILDGKDHEIQYTFNRNQKKQAIFLDGILLVSGEFTGELNAFTGYASYTPKILVESPINIEVSFE